MSGAEQADATVVLTPELLVSEIRHLPSAPKVLPRLKRLLQDANAPLDEIIKLIRLDPCIALSVLQMGNAAYFARGERCATVEDAVRRVGFDRVYEMVAYAVASQVLVRPLDVYGIESEVLWQRSVACALSAEVLAEITGEDAPIAYTAGLLHAVGMVAIDEWALRHRRDLQLAWTDEAREFSISERAELGFDQAEVGAALLRTWEFPTEMWLPLHWQYDPAGAASHGRLAAIVCVAKWLSYAALSTGAPPALPESRVLKSLRISSDRLRFCLPEVRRRLSAVSEIVSFDPESRAA